MLEKFTIWERQTIAARSCSEMINTLALRMQNHYLKPFPKLLIWAIDGPSMKHSLDNTWIWHSLGDTWIWYGFCFPYQTHTWPCLHSATSLLSHTNTTWSLNPHYGHTTYIAVLHAIPVSARHSCIWCENAMGIWESPIQFPYHPGMLANVIWEWYGQLP